MLCGLQLVESVDSGPQLHITNYKVTLGFLTAKRVGAPNPCVGQASTVFQWPPSQSPSFHPFLLEGTLNRAPRVIWLKYVISCQTFIENFPVASHSQ